MKPGKIEIKNASVLVGLMLYKFHPILAEIIAWVAEKFGVVLTESFRHQTHPNDLHGTDPVRAIDIRFWCYLSKLAYQIKDAINNRWAYDPDRSWKEVAIIHDVGKGIHFHIQVHPNTRRRK